MKTESVSQRILSPRKGLTPGGSVGDDEALSNIQPGLLIDGSQCFVLSERALYEFRAADTTAESLPLIVAPAGGQPGRWRFLTSGTQSLSDEVAVTANDTTPGVLEPKVAAGIGITKTILNPGGNEQLSLSVTSTVADVAALAAVNADLVWVSTLRCYWHRNPTSTLTPDGITVVASSIGGNWERLVETTSPTWLTQTTWYIDPATGNDESAGFFSTPIKTFAELQRRWGPNAVLDGVKVAINLVGDADEEVEIDAETINGASIRLIGSPTTVVAGATIASAQSWSYATGANGQAGELTVASIADWSIYKYNIPGGGYRIRRQADNGYGFVLDTGAAVSTARVTRVVTKTGSADATSVVATNFAIGQVIDIQKMPAITSLLINVRSRHYDFLSPIASVIVDGIYISDPIPGPTKGILRLVNCGGDPQSLSEDPQVMLFASAVRGSIIAGGASCLLAGCGLGITAEGLRADVIAGGGGPQFNAGSVVRLTDTVGLSGAGFKVLSSSYLDASQGSIGVFDANNASGLEVDESSDAIVNEVYGSGNDDYGCEVRGRVWYGSVPKATGALGDNRIGGAVVANGALPSITAANNAMIVAAV